jgi:hypothetical protein
MDDFKLRSASNTGLVNPFAKEAVITLKADLSTGATQMTTNITIPYNVLISILLLTAHAVTESWAKADSLIIKPEKKEGQNAAKENSDN